MIILSSPVERTDHSDQFAATTLDPEVGRNAMESAVERDGVALPARDRGQDGARASWHAVTPRPPSD